MIWFKHTLVAALLVGTIAGQALADDDGDGDKGDKGDKGGSESLAPTPTPTAASSRSCPNPSKAPDTLYAEFSAGANKISGTTNVPYRSCDAKCQATDTFKDRNTRLAALIGNAGYAVAVGKGSADDLDNLADKLVEKDRQGEWGDLAGLDCNGFVGRYLTINYASIWGPPLEATNLKPQNAEAIAKSKGVKPVSTADACPGDFAAYKNVSHVVLLGAKRGTFTVNGNELTVFDVYESHGDGTIKSVTGSTGLVHGVEGFNAAGTSLYVLKADGDGYKQVGGDRDVVILPSDGNK